MNKINNLLIVLIIAGLNYSCEKESSKYLGQLTPGDIPVIFAPGIISTGLYERDMAISPDGDEFYFSLFMGDWNTIMVSKEVNGKWQEPVVAPFARDTNYFFAEPAFSYDGKKIFYLSTKPRENETPKPGWSNQNIWFAERLENGEWDVGKPLPQNINAMDEFYPSLTKDGTLYFCRTNMESGVSQIFRSRMNEGIFQDPELLPSPVNSKGTIFNAAIAPDESFLIGCVAGRDSLKPANQASYILFFRNDDDTWSQGIDLVKEMNLPCPNAISISLSPDAKYLFFSSSRKLISFKDVEPFWSYSKLSKRRISYGNGNSDIYWIRFDKVIQELKKKSLYL